MNKILVVEDDESIREVLKQALEIEGLSVETASNGQEALNKLRHDPVPNLILLDLMMPVLDGWEFMKIRSTDQRLKSVPVVIVSAFSDHASNIDCQGVLGKPIDFAELIEIVNRYNGKTVAA